MRPRPGGTCAFEAFPASPECGADSTAVAAQSSLVSEAFILGLGIAVAKLGAFVEEEVARPRPWDLPCNRGTAVPGRLREGREEVAVAVVRVSPRICSAQQVSAAGPVGAAGAAFGVTGLDFCLPVRSRPP